MEGAICTCNGTYSPERTKDMLPFATAWMDLEGIALRAISQTEKDKECTMSLIRGILETKLIKTESSMVVARD